MLIAFLLTVFLGATQDTPFDPAGSWSLEAESGFATLILDLGDDGAVSGHLLTANGGCVVSGEFTTDEDDESSVEGTWDCGSGGAEFEFYPTDDGGFEVLIIPVGGDGIPRSDLVEFWPATRGDTTPAAETTLVGSWSTQVVMNSPSGSIATQMFMQIRSDGTLHDLGSRSAGGGADWGGETGLLGAGESANWRTNADVLEISYQGSPWVPLARFLVQGDQLSLAWYDGGTAIWYREQP